MNKSDQALEPKKSIPQSIEALSWHIATEPKLYRDVASNPYTHRARQIISERFPDTNSTDGIHAIILAEPEGKYDRNLNLLTIRQQEEDLSKQKEIGLKINKRLAHYLKTHKNKLHRLSRESVYNDLVLFVFETADPKEIELRFSQIQRRDLKLAIVDFIESLPEIKTTKKKAVWKQPVLQKVFAGVLLMVFLFSIYQIYAIKHAQSNRQTLGTETQSHGLPVRLIIPKLKVDASIEYVGVTPDGEMGVPNDIFNVGWFDLGPRPGERGNAVIAGHFDGENGKPGIFSSLSKLKAGDKVYVTYGHGKSVAFVVRKIQIYTPGYAEEVFKPSDSAHLNLVTCDGVWNKTQKSYSKRLVVFTDLVP